MGNDIITANYQYYQADLLLTLCDIFKLAPSVQGLASMNVAHWIPIDCDPLGKGDLFVLREGMGTPIAVTRFGQEVMRDDGLDPYYVPHGVDINVFTPGKRDEVRTSLGFDEDVFVIGICAMNRDPVRKGLVEQVMAFREFWEKHPQSKLMMHTAPVSDVLHLEALVQNLGFPEGVVMFPDKYSLATGVIGNEAMCAWYCALDILSACSYGEGFCVPVLEAQACGVPVVVTDFSGQGEMCLSGWKIPGEKYWINGHESWWRRPAVRDIVNAYEAAWQMKDHDEIGELREIARKEAMAFDANKITADHWTPVLNGIQANLKGGL